MRPADIAAHGQASIGEYIELRPTHHGEESRRTDAVTDRVRVHILLR
jgi:hypothetical protein